MAAIQRHKGLAEDVYGAIFNKLMSLDIAPGSRITVDGLVAAMLAHDAGHRAELGALAAEFAGPGKTA